MPLTEIAWDQPIFVLRSAPMSRLDSFLQLAGVPSRIADLHVMSHAGDEDVLRSIAGRDLTFHPYPERGPYVLCGVPRQTLERLRSIRFGTLVYLDAAIDSNGLDDIKRLMAAIDEPRVLCYRGDGTLARPSGTRPLRPRPRIHAGTDGPPTAGGRPLYFMVTSQGLAATAWLAASLNLHPDITCSVGIDHPLVSMRFYYNHDLIRCKTNAVDRPDDIRHGFYSTTLRTHFGEALAARGIAFDGDLVRAKPMRQLQHMYDELEWFEPQSTYYGNTHACFAQEAFEYLAEWPTRRDVVLINLIRHPVPRTEAAVKGVLTVPTHYSDSDWHRGLTEAIDELTERRADLRHEIESRFGVDFRQSRNRAVLYSYYGAVHNDAWAAEITSLPDVCHAVIERLMSDRDYFAWLVWELTRRRLAASPEYLDQVFTEEHLRAGRHTGHGRAPGPRDQWDAWTPWEQHEFRQVEQRLGLADVYAPFGYDFSFVG